MTELIDPHPYLSLEVQVGPIQDLGDLDGVGRRCIPIIGGAVRGALSGVVLSGGADWQYVTRSGLLEISAQYVLDCDGRRIEVTSTGVRDASPEVTARLMRGEPVSADDYYFRTLVRLRSSAPELAHLSRRLFIGRGERMPDLVCIAVHKLL